MVRINSLTYFDLTHLLQVMVFSGDETFDTQSTMHLSDHAFAGFTQGLCFWFFPPPETIFRFRYRPTLFSPRCPVLPLGLGSAGG